MGHLFVQQLFIEHLWLPDPMRDARAAEIEEVTDTLVSGTSQFGGGGSL